MSNSPHGHAEPKPLRSRYITLDEIRPTVELADWGHFKTTTWWQSGLLQPNLCLVESGKYEVRTAVGTVVAQAGSLLCVPPAPRFTHGLTGPSTIWMANVRFAPPPQQHLLPWLPEVGPAPLCVSLAGPAFENAQRLFQTIYAELPRSTLADQVRVRAVIFELLAIMQDAARAGSPVGESPPRPSVKKMDVWQRARLRLESDLRRPLSMEALARELKVTPDYFTRQFRRRFGSSPHACRTRAKLREAMRLLRRGGDGSGEPIKSVAYHLGFRDPHAFARLFKRHMGVNPSQLTGGPGQPADDRPPAELIHGVNHALPADRDSSAPFDAMTEIVASAPPPFPPESIIYRRKG